VVNRCPPLVATHLRWSASDESGRSPLRVGRRSLQQRGQTLSYPLAVRLDEEARRLVHKRREEAPEAIEITTEEQRVVVHPLLAKDRWRPQRRVRDESFLSLRAPPTVRTG
jgi:hypothetical protein